MTSISAPCPDRGTWLRRCWNCGAPVGGRAMFCAKCGARQRDPKRVLAYQSVGR